MSPVTPPVQFVQSAPVRSSASTLAIILMTPPVCVIITVGVSTPGTPPRAWVVLRVTPFGTENLIASPSRKIILNVPSPVSAEPLTCNVYGFFARIVPQTKWVSGGLDPVKNSECVVFVGAPMLK